MTWQSVSAEARQRADGRCEYCRFPQVAVRFTFPIDHVIARRHGGTDDLNNLALACHFCNRSKGPNLSSVDPFTGRVVRLYHPRRDRWSRHLEWAGLHLVGRTAAARATIRAPAMNGVGQVARRQALEADGVYSFSD